MAVSPESIRAYLESLSSFSASVQQKAKCAIKQSLERSTINPLNLLLIEREFKKIKTKKADKKILSNKVLTKKEIEFLKSKATKRMALILELLEITGLRISELINLKLKDIDCSSQGHCIAKVLGKGKKERRVYLHETHVDRCLEIFNSQSYLLETKGGNKYIRNNINKEFRRLSLKVDIKFTPHSLRHSFATHTLICRGRSLKSVSSYLGHSTTALTADMYIHDSLKPEDVLI